MMRKIALLALPAVSMAFGPAMPFGTTHGLARATSARSAAVPALRMAVLEVNSAEDLDGQIAGAGDSKLVVIDYSTTWCGPCKVIAPKFEELSGKYPDAVFLKCVGDSSPEATKLMKREGIRSVPAFHFWKKGAKVEVIAGANVQALENTIKDNL